MLSEEIMRAKAFTDLDVVHLSLVHPVKSIKAICPLFWDLSVLNMCSGTYDLKLQYQVKYALFAISLKMALFC